MYLGSGRVPVVLVRGFLNSWSRHRCQLASVQLVSVPRPIVQLLVNLRTKRLTLTTPFGCCLYSTVLLQTAHLDEPLRNLPSLGIAWGGTGRKPALLVPNDRCHERMPW